MSTTEDVQNNYHCSFCGKAQRHVKRLIAGPSRVFICDECVELCSQIIAEENSTTNIHSTEPLTSEITPKRIYEQLDEYVVGQEQAKKVLSVAVYNHYKRISTTGNSDIELQKTNVLMLGPAGTGKTLLAQTLASILDVPFAIADATSLTEAGYVGEDVENILLRLIQAADFDISRAEHGIIYIDEIDKLARKSPNPSITRDVSGEGVQQALLKIIEGCVANVPPHGGRKHPQQDFLQIKTNHILFMCGGAFEGLSDLVEWRLSKSKASVGFTAHNLKPIEMEQEENVLEMVSLDDLVNYGFIPELVGRVPLTVGLNQLDQSDLIRILTEPKNALIKQYKTLFKMDNVELIFTNESLEVAAQEALKQGTGARALRSILERTLLDVMYEIPSLDWATQCVVDADSILGKSSVKLTRKDESPATINAREKKSA